MSTQKRIENFVFLNSLVQKKLLIMRTLAPQTHSNIYFNLEMRNILHSQKVPGGEEK